MQNELKDNLRRFAVLLLLAVLLFVVLWGGQTTALSAYAESTSYSDVLDDLRKDENFSPSTYPTVADDYSLQVIQVAESTGKELFVYVYQPSGQAKDLRASYITIALTPRENFSEPKVYSLTLLNSSGVFYKYRVDGLTVSTQTTRYYTVTTILRPFDETIDDDAEHGNEVTNVEYEVAKEYCFSTINGEPFFRVLEVETIEITDKFVGFVRYSNGFELYPSACDSHFVAFNTDRDMDRVLEADVYYSSQSYSISEYIGVPIPPEETFGEKQDKYAYLDYTQKVEHTGDGWFAPTYKWDRIETVEQFIEENEAFQNVYSGVILDVNVGNKITEEGKAALKDKEWVLRFVETSYETWSGYDYEKRDLTLIGDVMILRLKFETDGVVYNLGTIDNMQTGGRDPINDEHYEVGLSDTGKWILAIIALIILIIVLGPILPYIIKAVVWIVMLPFKAIATLVKGIQKAAKKKPKQAATSLPKVQSPQPKAVYRTAKAAGKDSQKTANKDRK